MLTRRNTHPTKDAIHFHYISRPIVHISPPAGIHHIAQNSDPRPLGVGSEIDTVAAVLPDLHAARLIDRLRRQPYEGFGRMLEHYYPRDAWRSMLPESRLTRALALREERRRNGQPLPLAECLHFADKGYIVAQNAEIREQFGFDSRRAAKRAFGQVEALRNSLAHANPIVDRHWEIILIFSHRIEAIIGQLDARPSAPGAVRE